MTCPAALLLLTVSLGSTPAADDPAPRAAAPDGSGEGVRLRFEYEPSSDVVIHPGMMQDEAEIQPAPTPVPRFGMQGSERWTIQAGGGVDVDGDNYLALGGLGWTHFLADHFSINLELNGMYFDQDGDDPAGVNFNILFRWHFLVRDTWTMYADGGAGLLGTTSDVPDHGSSFNFTPQAGFGFSFDIGDNNRLLLGARWHHVSNANTYDENPGRDSIMGYAMISFPF